MKKGAGKVLPFTRLNMTSKPVRETEKMNLLFHPSWSLPIEDQYVYRFFNNHLPPLQTIGLQEVTLNERTEGIDATVFIRNGTKKPVSFQEETLVLYSGTERVAREKFQLHTLGEIPPQTNMPWTFFFRREIILVDQPVNKDNWTVSFEQQNEPKQITLDLEDSWQQSMSLNGKEQLLKLIETLKEPTEDTISFQGLQLYEKKNALVLIFIVHNTTNEDIFLNELTCTVFNSQKETIAKGTFHLGGLQIKKNTSKPWSLIFSPEQTLTNQYNPFQKWSILITETS